MLDSLSSMGGQNRFYPWSALTDRLLSRSKPGQVAGSHHVVSGGGGSDSNTDHHFIRVTVPVPLSPPHETCISLLSRSQAHQQAGRQADERASRKRHGSRTPQAQEHSQTYVPQTTAEPTADECKDSGENNASSVSNNTPILLLDTQRHRHKATHLAPVSHAEVGQSLLVVV